VDVIAVAVDGGTDFTNSYEVPRKKVNDKVLDSRTHAISQGNLWGGVLNNDNKPLVVGPRVCLFKSKVARNCKRDF